jgi:hypothetical protein
MTISKFLLFLCAAAAGALCLTVRAEDTDNAAQAAARIAIAKALFAEQATNAPASSAGTNAVMAPVNDKASQTEAKTDKDTADAQAQAQVVAAKKTEADQAALATAQTNKLVNMDMSGTITNVPESATNSWASATPSESKPAATTAKKDKKKKKEKSAPVASTNAVPQKVPMTDTNYIGGSLGMKPIPAPPLPISASKDDRLKELLQKYQADQITPEEYHQQRAAILAEP